MTAAILHAYLAVLFLAVIGWGGRVVYLVVADTVQRGRASAHGGASWDCRCLSRLDRLDGLVCECGR